MSNPLQTTRRLLPPVLAAAIVLACFPSQLAAQDADDSDPLGPLTACQSENDPATRLACYDSAVKALVVAEESGQLRVVDAEEVRKTRRSLFGFTIPDLGIFTGRASRDGSDEEPAFDVLETTVTSVRYRTPNSFAFRIADGNALWEVDDAPRRLLRVVAGSPVMIRKGALGSFFIRFDGQGA